MTMRPTHTQDALGLGREAEIAAIAIGREDRQKECGQRPVVEYLHRLLLLRHQDSGVRWRAGCGAVAWLTRPSRRTASHDEGCTARAINRWYTHRTANEQAGRCHNGATNGRNPQPWRHGTFGRRDAALSGATSA